MTSQIKSTSLTADSSNVTSKTGVRSIGQLNTDGKDTGEGTDEILYCGVIPDNGRAPLPPPSIPPPPIPGPPPGAPPRGVGQGVPPRTSLRTRKHAALGLCRCCGPDTPSLFEMAEMRKNFRMQAARFGDKYADIFGGGSSDEEDEKEADEPGPSATVSEEIRAGRLDEQVAVAEELR